MFSGLHRSELRIEKDHPYYNDIVNSTDHEEFLGMNPAEFNRNTIVITSKDNKINDVTINANNENLWAAPFFKKADLTAIIKSSRLVSIPVYN